MNTRALAWPLGVQVFVCSFFPSQLNEPSSIPNSVNVTLYYLTVCSLSASHFLLLTVFCLLSPGIRMITVFSSLTASPVLLLTIFSLLSAGTRLAEGSSAHSFQFTVSFSLNSIPLGFNWIGLDWTTTVDNPV